MDFVEDTKSEWNVLLNWIIINVSTMDRRLNLFFIFTSANLLFFGCQSKIDRLNERIENEFAGQSGVFALAFQDLSTGEKLSIRENETFHAASTMKVPVMIEIYKKAAAGKFSLDDSVVVRNEFTSIADGSRYRLEPGDDSEQDLYTKEGTKRTLYSLVYDMIIVSSNLATNIVIEMADPKEVTQTMRDLGAKDMLVLRGVEDQKAFDKGMINTTTAHDLLLIFEKMAKGEIVNPDASRAMVEILRDQKFKSVIPARLPSDAKVAHKTGDYGGVVRHDAGIIFLPDGRKYVLVLLSKELKDDEAATKAMANVSEMIYQYVVSK